MSDHRRMASITDTPQDVNIVLEKKDSVPTVIVSEPSSPQLVTKEATEELDQPYDEGEEGSEYGGNELAFSSSLSINRGAMDVETALPVPPDGGYGWVIVIAAFMSNLVVDGICTAFSEFKPSYSEHFQASDATTALIGSLLIGCYLLVGPIIGGLVNKYGARIVVIVGSIIGGLGIGLSAFAPNITVFMILYGVVGGIGFGAIYLPAIVIVGFYFESKRAVATGLSVAGSGVGTIVMPILSEYCIRVYGWQTALLVFAACVFSCILFGFLYRPLTAETNPPVDREMTPLKQALSKMEDDDIENGAAEKIRMRTTSEGEDAKSPENGHRSRQGTAPSTSAARPRKHTITSMTSDMTSNFDLRNSKGNLHRMSARSFAQSLSKISGHASNLSIACSGVDPQEFSRPLNRQDVFYGGSIKNLKEFKEEGNMADYRGSIVSIPRSTIAAAASQQHLAGDIAGSRMSRLTGGLAEDEIEEVDDSKCKCIPLPIRNACSEMIDVELLKDPVMMLLCISNLLGMMGFYIPFVFLKDLATVNGVDPDSSKWLVPVIGITNTVGRVFFGWFADRGVVSAIAINNFSLISCGILTFICPWFTSFTSMMVYASVFGFIISAYICLTSIVLADILGLDKLTSSFGLLVVARGVASLSGSPFAGLVYDLTKSYQMAFYFAGIVIVIAGLVSCAVPFADRWKRSKGDNEGEYYYKDADAVSGKLSVLTEHSEENLTEYQRTIQSLKQQHQLFRELEEEKKKLRDEKIDEEDDAAHKKLVDGKQ